MSSQSKPLATLNIAKSRPRGDTTTLLPPSYNPDSDEIPAAPEPEELLYDYTTERLQQGLIFAQKFLSNRNISPRAETFMIIYEETLKDALNADTQGERAEHAAAIRITEKLIQQKGFLKRPSSPHQTELQDHVLQLRELQYYMRYGDRVKIIPMRLRIHASKSKTENWQLLSGRRYWSTIADKLQEEEKQRKEARAKDQNMDNVSLDTHIAVSRACTELGLEEELAVWSILEYATRNTQAHRNLSEMREAGKFPLLAQTLWTDREDLDSTFSEFKSPTDKSFLRQIVQTEIDTWFDTSADPSNPGVWQAHQALTDCYMKAKEQSLKPMKEETKQANIDENQKAPERKGRKAKSSIDGWLFSGRHEEGGKYGGTAGLGR